MLENRNMEIDMKEIFRLLKQKCLIILFVGVLVGGACGIYTKYISVPQYQSSTKLYVITKSKKSIVSLADLQTGSQIAQDYIVAITTKPVLKKVIKNLDLKMSVSKLKDKITINNLSDTRILEITVTDENPERAKNIANEVARVGSRQIGKKMDIQNPEILELAEKSNKPIGTTAKKNVIFGGLIGMILSGFFIIVRFITKDAIQNQEQVEYFLGLNTLAEIPVSKYAGGSRK